MHFSYNNVRATIQQALFYYIIKRSVLSVLINVDLNFFVDSYDDRATTQKILQKLKLENFQVCFL